MIKKINIEIAGIVTQLIVDSDFYQEVNVSYYNYRSDRSAEYILHVNLVDKIFNYNNDNREYDLQNNYQNYFDKFRLFIQDSRMMIICEMYSGYMDLQKKEGEVEEKKK